MITHSRLKDLLEYDHTTGVFLWKKSSANGAYKAGAVAGSKRSCRANCGRYRVQIDGKGYGLQKLGYFYRHGRWPEPSVHYPELTVERLKSRLMYDPQTGVFYRRSRDGRPTEIVAGGISRGPRDGYLRIRIDGKRYKAHRLAFLFMTGEWPKGLVDHRDTNKENNAWGNLRDASHGQNKANCRAYRNNRLGVKGVSRKGKKFFARIRKDDQLHHLGTFSTIEQAQEAYRVAAVKLHGEYARAA